MLQIKQHPVTSDQRYMCSNSCIKMSSCKIREMERGVKKKKERNCTHKAEYQVSPKSITG
jgi:hypothetical protein